MTLDHAQLQPASSPGRQRPEKQLRVAIIDRDSGFMQVLTKRLTMSGAACRALPSPGSTKALIPMRLDALVIDLDVLGPIAWEYLARTASVLPTLAVVVCTGPSSVAQRARGLRLGADAWINKPCHPEEVVAVIEAAVRRHHRHQLPELAAATTVGGVTIRPDAYQAYVGDQSAQLTRREFEIIKLLSRSTGVLRREEIYERVWGYTMTHGDRSVDVYVRKLRQKLQTVSPEWNYIHTHFGVGYRLAPELQSEVTDIAPESAGSAFETEIAPRVPTMSQ